MEPNRTKFLFIGVGDAGRTVIKKIKGKNIPDSEYLSFGPYADDDSDEYSDPPHYNIINMNGWEYAPSCDLPTYRKEITQNVEDQIRDIIISKFKKID